MYLCVNHFILSELQNTKYRVRDEIVNEQEMIEEQYDKELLLNSSNPFAHSWKKVAFDQHVQV